MLSNLRQRYTLLIASLGCVFSSFGQTQNPVTITLANPDSGNKTYIARETVNLEPGYTYFDNQSMLACIEPHTQYQPVLTNSSFNNASINTSLQVGYTPGNHGVELSGAASYNVPLIVPQGTNGVMPNLSIHYNSQRGNDILGMGWSLDGLSTISVVQSAWYSEGKTEEVQFDGTDRFAIDGNKLVATNGNYGADATTYATEVESYIRVTSHGWGTTPDWFKVETKEGVTAEYGRTDDSRINGMSGNTAGVWRINKVYDAHGNYMTFKYRSENRDVRIDEIRYTGNSNAGVLPYNRVKFHYATRDDNNTVYISGTEHRTKYLLTKVLVYSDGEHFKSYGFDYGMNHYSLLNSITEYDAEKQPLNPTIFQYGNPGNPFETASTSSLSISYSDLDASRDFNGDGLSDVLVRHFYYDNTPQASKIYTSWEVFKSNGDNTFTHYASGAIPSGYHMFFDSNVDDIKVAGIGTHLDYFGDGSDDILLVRVGSSSSGGTLSSIKIIDINGQDDTQEHNPILSQGGYINLSRFLHIGDFDGDGADDIFIFRYGSPSNLNYYGRLLTRNNAEEQIVSVLLGLEYLQAANNFFSSDFDGDGKEEITVVFNNSCEIFELKSQPVNGYYHVQKIYHSANPGFPTQWHEIIPGDFNGDGKTDLLTTGDDVNWFIGYSNGSYFVNKPFSFLDTPDMSSSSESLRIGDFNGDGKTDILHASAVWQGQTASSSKLDIYYSKGETFTSQTYPIGLITSYNDFVIGDFNGDAKMEVINRDIATSPATIFFFNKNGQPYMLHKVKDGFGRVVEFTNSWLSQTSNTLDVGVIPYSGVFPLTTFKASIPIVENVSIPDGIGGVTTTNHFYGGALWHRSGKGFLGYKRTTAENSTTGMRSTSEYDLDYSFRFLSLTSETNELMSTNYLISKKTFTNNTTALGGIRYKSEIVQILDENFLNTTTTQTDITYDGNGNKLSVTRANNAETTVTNNQYTTHGSWWIPSRLTNTTITTTRSGETPYSRTKTYAYNPSGTMSQEVSDPGSPKAVTKNYLYDQFGNTRQINTSASGLPTTIARTKFDNKGRFPVKTYNALNQITEYEYDRKWNKPIKVIDISGLETVFNYDGLGNLIETINPKGEISTVNKIWDIANNGNGGLDPINTLFYREGIAPGSPDRRVWFDLLRREVKSEGQGLSGLITSVTKYDQRGNQLSTTDPFFAGESPLIRVNTYDVYNRLTNTTNGITSTSYTYTANSGNLTITVQEPSQQIIKVTDASGKVISSSDAAGTLNFTYYSNGLQKDVSMNSTVLTSMEYDQYGRQSKLIDINGGTTEYDYNAYGQLISQSDANGKTFQIAYDVLGHETSKTSPGGTISTTYITAGDGLNNIEQITGVNGESITYAYDEFNRIVAETKTIDGTPYSTNYTYNSYDQMTGMTYPSGFEVKMNYNASGYLLDVTDESGSITLFSSPSQNSRGQYTQYTLGDGITTSRSYNNLGFLSTIVASGVQDYEVQFNNATGNLLDRRDYLKNRTESFEYDLSNRLTKSQVSLVSSPLTYLPVELTYLDNGNIDTKTGVGQYTYDSQRINAVIGVDNQNDAISFDQQDITYTEFDRTASISEGVVDINFTYDPLFNKSKSESFISGTLTKTKLYLGNYEQEVTPSGTKEIHYIPTGEGYNAVYILEGGTGSYYYLYKDHLNSVVAVTNENGVVEFEQNFDPWGERRDPLTWSGGAVIVPTDFTWVPGFTGHEHLDEVGLIDMNNRMYDPAIGRMLAVDNFIQNPYLTQHYNRYSYANNNPLVYTDPTGEIAWAPVVIGAVVGTYIGGTLANDGNPNPFEWDYGSGKTWGYMFSGAIVGGVSGGIGGAISSSGIAFANTVAIITSSTFYSVGTALYTKGQTDVSINFGVGSYNVSSNEWGYLGKKGNSFGENLGYTIGAISNISDLLAGLNPSEVTLRTAKDPNYDFKGKPGYDPIGHSQITDGTDIIIDWGPQNGAGFFDFVPATNSYEAGTLVTNQMGGKFWDAINVVGVNEKTLGLYKQMLDNGGKYNLLFNSCVSQTSRSLNLSGVFNIGILPGVNHPYWLHFQLYLRSVGVRPMLFSHYLNN